MPYRLLCNDVQREGTKPSRDLVSGLFCYVPLHNFWYGINGTIPWLKSGEVAQGFIYEAEEKITEAGLANSSAKIFPVNTVLVAMYGATAGQVGLLKFAASTNQAICGILPNSKFIPEFLYWVLKSRRDYMVTL